MTKTEGWDIPTLEGSDEIALEFLTADIDQSGAPDDNGAPYFNPCNIAIEDGIYYASIYICSCRNDMVLSQRLALWFGSLSETDIVRLTVSSTLTGIPLTEWITVLAAINNTKAQVEIQLNQIVIDHLAYFYLMCKNVKVGFGGALFVPSYVDNRASDMSGPLRAISDFFQWIVEMALGRGRITQEEAERLMNGKHVVISKERLSGWNS